MTPVKPIAALVALSLLSACSDMPQAWKYERTEDKLRDVTEVTATLASDEEFEIHGHHYRISFEVKRSHGEPDYGWFPNRSDCNPQNPVLIRLDDGPIEAVPCLRLHSILPPVSRIDEQTIRRIEQATTMVVEIPSEDSQLTFDVRGLAL